VILNFGSINIDNVYRVENMPLAGETIAAKSYDKVIGGKGINQSVASHRAGGHALHVGYIGDDAWVSAQIDELQLDNRFIKSIDTPTGHAIIYVDDAGENEIVIFAGANGDFEIDAALRILDDHQEQKPWVVLQNEINLSVEVAKVAKERGCRVSYSAAPFDADHAGAILPYLDLLALNETEYADLKTATGKSVSDIDVAMVLVTLGAKGAKLFMGDQLIEQDSFEVTPIDTTGAGDTFLGAFVARMDCGDTPETALEFAAAAAAIQVTRMGATPAIPNETEIREFLAERTS